MMRKAFKFRLFPNKNQIREMEITLESHRRLYNQCLEWRQFAYETYGVTLTSVDFSRWFTHSARSKNPYYARLNVTSANATMRNLDKAFAAFFRRCKSGEKPGYPRFKGKQWFNSFTYFVPKGGGAKLVNGKLRLQHIGTIRIKLHREIEGRIKSITVKREAGNWFVVFSCDLGEVEFVPNGKPSIGIDVGLRHFYTTSDGHHEPNPRFLKQTLPKLRRAQRALARKKHGGANRQKAIVPVQRLHTRVKNQRRDFHFKTARKLTANYGSIAVESLNIRGMLRNRRLARSIADAGWGQFVDILRPKAHEAGATVTAIDPKYTSQDCSQCGERVPKALSVRVHHCPFCGFVADRDHNAAQNILARAIANGR